MYATGLLAIGLAASDACAEAVRNGMAVELAKVGQHLIAKLIAGLDCHWALNWLSLDSAVLQTEPARPPADL